MKKRTAGHAGLDTHTGSFHLRWWTLSQRIRTLAHVPFETELLDTSAAPLYQQIAPKAFQLQQLGLSNSSIAKRLGVTDKTAAKAVGWLRRVEHRFNV